MEIKQTLKQNLHLFVGGAAAGLAMALPRNNSWKLPLTTIATLELGQGLLKYKSSLQVPAADTDDVAAPENSYTDVVGDITMRWEEHGDSAPGSLPVVLVHGIPTHPRLWRYVIPKVAREGIRCYAWELVGFGWSMEEGLERDISVAKQAEYLYAWLLHKGITQAVFVGHDLGGGVLQRLLSQHPELCMGLTLVDCVAYRNWPVKLVQIARAMSSLIEKLPAPLLKPLYLAGVINLGHDNAKRRWSSYALHWQPYARSVGPKAFAHQLRNLDSDDTAELVGQLANIVAPAHVVWGDADPLGMTSGEQLATDLGAPLTRIPGGRHFTPEDHPTEVAAAVNSILKQVV
ncbi:pimeloyl-ACP methyl ester carboxylesterase [Pontibacter ummariensis]|uniref:Pimeloyl-ACP methyl ester carboxylesterase n=1 Tax=Pontibacter ummariensis TaxID=1610492 RepID=A0A239H3P6_9BACT|nr:alpha/beta hydrolase [Pontibacter ummariensis]PRY10896.1 pimeloyl-ACP methyl ester carboxylesterase [Pontibacter ummariensis]SNS76007.1 Pimeloyl-ACP methyl ester carboxylesterase [Pontibacter ummariensis]